MVGGESWHLKKLHVIEEVGPNACRGMIEALGELNYKHLVDIWFIKAGLGDDGVKHLANYM